MYIEVSSPRVIGDKAKLELSLCENGDEACLTFYYHMYGNTTGTLNVFSGSKVVFSASGNKGNYWQKAERTIYLDKVVSHLSNIIVFFFNTLIIPGVNNSYLK